jgi:hypothetical protein
VEHPSYSFDCAAPISPKSGSVIKEFSTDCAFFACFWPDHQNCSDLVAFP